MKEHVRLVASGAIDRLELGARNRAFAHGRELALASNRLGEDAESIDVIAYMTEVPCLIGIERKAGITDAAVAVETDVPLLVGADVSPRWRDETIVGGARQANEVARAIDRKKVGDPRRARRIGIGIAGARRLTTERESRHRNGSRLYHTRILGDFAVVDREVIVVAEATCGQTEGSPSCSRKKAPHSPLECHSCRPPDESPALGWNVLRRANFLSRWAKNRRPSSR
jgi:hypothetical protein